MTSVPSFDQLQWSTPQLHYIASLLQELNAARQCIAVLNKSHEHLLHLLQQKNNVASSMAAQSKLLSSMFQQMNLSENNTTITTTNDDDEYEQIYFDNSPEDEEDELTEKTHVDEEDEEDEEEEEEYVLPFDGQSATDDNSDSAMSPLNLHNKEKHFKRRVRRVQIVPKSNCDEQQQEQALLLSESSEIPGLELPEQTPQEMVFEAKTPIISRKLRAKRRRMVTPSPAKLVNEAGESPVQQPSTAIKAVQKKMKHDNVDLCLVPLHESVILNLTSDFSVQVNKPTESRRFGCYPHNIPLSIQMFNDAQWQSNVFFGCDEESFDPEKNMSFQSTMFKEMLLDEWDTFDYLKDNEDACVIGIGTDIIVTHLDPVKHRDISNFDVWIIRPSLDQRLDGPFYIADIVRNMYTSEENANDETDVEHLFMDSSLQPTPFSGLDQDEIEKIDALLGDYDDL